MTDMGQGYMPDETTFTRRLQQRNQWGRVWRAIFLFATLVGLLTLITLFLSVMDDAFGTVALASENAPEAISDRPLEELEPAQLALLLGEYAPRRLRVIVRDELSVVEPSQFTLLPITEALGEIPIPFDWETLTVNDLTDEQIMTLLEANLSRDTLYEYVIKDVVGLRILKSWSLSSTLFDYGSITAEFERLVADQNPPNPRLEVRAWLSADFVSSPQSSYPEIAGVRTAVLGTLWIMVITIAIAFPLGVGAAIYLEEYAHTGNWLERLIETNIRNLAGVPSIIYGLLALAVFVRLFGPITSGAVFGLNVPEQSESDVVVRIAGAVGIPAMPDGMWATLVTGLEKDELSEGAVADLLFSLPEGELQRAVVSLSDAQYVYLQEQLVAFELPVPDPELVSPNENRLTEGELNSLIDTFFAFRRLPIIDAGASPADVDFRQGIGSAMNIAKLDDTQFNALVRALTDYSRVVINGRTILSASLALALLILPVIIIASQEAIRAVPSSIREGSYGLGATKWQTIWRNVLPASMPGILTGTILSLSRAIGETAPLIVVGASTVISADPNGPFAKFTALPIQIYQWTARPQDEFRNIAAAAIIVLLVLLVLINSAAIILRQRFNRRLRA